MAEIHGVEYIFSCSGSSFFKVLGKNPNVFLLGNVAIQNKAFRKEKLFTFLVSSKLSWKVYES